MFGLRTPVKQARPAPGETKSPKKDEPAMETTGLSKDTRSTSVRRSVEGFEAKTGSATPTLTAPPLGQPVTSQPKVAATSTAEPPKRPVCSGISAASPPRSYTSRVEEAKAYQNKALGKIDESKNLKAEIKTAVVTVVKRLFQLVRDAELGVPYNGKVRARPKDADRKEEECKISEQDVSKDRELQREMIRKLEEHGQLLQRSTEEMERMKESMRRYQEVTEEKGTYARVAAGPPRRQETTHSVIITSTEERDSGEQVIQRIRTAVNAREAGLRIENVRKARDGKVILGCRTKEELGRVKDRLRKSGNVLQVEDMKNKDPLVILRDVLQCHSDEELLKALRAQNKHLFGELGEGEDRMVVKFRRKARNALLNHVVLVVSPSLWNRMTLEGTVCVDLQTVRVADQSPLVQCSRCLGYGHGKRFCREAADLCSHCGGPHLKSECADWLAKEPPTCCNCRKASHTDIGHNAFSSECPVRQRWETLARSAVAYC